LNWPSASKSIGQLGLDGRLGTRWDEPRLGRVAEESGLLGQLEELALSSSFWSATVMPNSFSPMLNSKSHQEFS
jgi:hypothetical protein